MMQETAAHRHWRWFFTLFLTVTGVLAVVFVLPRAVVFFFPFVIGWLIAVMASPLARWLEKKLHIRKKVGSVIVVVLVLAVVTVALYLVVSRLVREVADFIPKAPAYLQRLLDLLAKVEDWLSGVFKNLPENVRETLDGISKEVREALVNGVRDLSSHLASLIGNVSDKNVQQWMGHKDWHTTMQYYEYTAKTPDPDAAATVSQAIWG